MIAKRYLLAAAGITGSLATLIACSDDGLQSSREATGPAASVQAASVKLDISNAKGERMGSCAGVLIAPRLVLTAAHCVAGKAKWDISTGNGTRAEGLRGYTYDFKNPNNCEIDPKKHDVGVVHLDKAINLPSYPALASQTELGASVERVANTSLDLRQGNVHKVAGWPLSYAVHMEEGESLTTGGAVFNKDGHIVGVVSGRGMRTGNLYVARVDGMLNWLGRKLTCGGTVAAKDLGILCGGSGSKGGTCTKPDAGSGSGTSSSSSSSGGGGGADAGGGSSGSSGGSSGSSGGGSSGSSGGGGTSSSSGGTAIPGGGGGGDCSTGGGNCSGDCPGGAGGDGDSSAIPSAGGAGGSGSTTSASGGTVGSSSGSSGAAGSSGSSQSTSGTVGSNGPTGGGAGGTGGSGTKANPGGVSSSGGTVGSSGVITGGGAGGSDEDCSAPTSCVEDGDDLVDFGDSAGCKPQKGGAGTVLR